MLSRELAPTRKALHPPFDSADPAQVRLADPDASGSIESGLPPLRLLLVESDYRLRNDCAAAAAELGFEPVPAATAEEARSAFRQRAADLLLLDLHLPGGATLDLLAEIRERRPDTAVIVATAHASVSSAVDAMRLGACDYLIKPFAPGELADVLRRAARRVHFDLQSRRVRERLHTEKGMGGLIGRSPEMEKVYRILSKVAFSSHPVLILGESGTGKDLVARSIHSSGPDALRQFVAVNCSAVVPTLIESELFGHVKGAFAGATHAREGLLSTSNGGTVFLDEISELPLDLQAKLLRALQEKQIRPVGATQPVPLSARVLAASNRDLPEMVAQGRFRRDLFFRLNVVNIKLPRLRDRRDDIRTLAEFFLERNQAQTGVPHSLSADAVRVMSQYDWPGNVRELEHAIERACALSSGPVLHMADLPTQLHDFRMQAFAQSAGGAERHGGLILSIADRERQAIVDAIRQFRGDKLMAARVLGIGKTTLYRKLKDYGIAPEEISRA